MLKFMLKRALVWIGITQLSVLLGAVVFYKRLDLLSYINVSFVIGAAFVLIALAGVVMKGRFFDVVFYSFQYMFSRMTDKDRRSEEHTSELQSRGHLVCRLLLEKKNDKIINIRRVK